MITLGTPWSLFSLTTYRPKFPPALTAAALESVGYAKEESGRATGDNARAMEGNVCAINGRPTHALDELQVFSFNLTYLISYCSLILSPSKIVLFLDVIARKDQQEFSNKVHI